MIYTGALGPYKWQTKPRFGVKPDISNSLTQGMGGFYSCNEGQGLTVTDATRNVDLPLQFFGTNNPWYVGSGGLGIQTSGFGKCGAQATFPSDVWFNWPATIAVAVRIVGTANNGGRIFGMHTKNTATAPFTAITIYTNGSTSIGFGYATGTTGNFPSQFTTITQGVDYVFSFTVTPRNGYAFYVNGVKTFTGGSIIASPTWTSTALIFLAGVVYTTVNAACQPLYWGAWWNRALSDSEHYTIGQSINSVWQIMKPQIDYSSLYQPASSIVIPAGFSSRVLLGNSPFTLGQPSLLRR